MRGHQRQTAWLFVAEAVRRQRRHSLRHSHADTHTPYTHTETPKREADFLGQVEMQLRFVELNHNESQIHVTPQRSCPLKVLHRINTAF